jgi:DNA invertase Pin-like site-specific DNA recombinase
MELVLSLSGSLNFRRLAAYEASARHLQLYFAESERDFISLRTKSGLAAARASGTQLGRPIGARNKHRILDPYQTQIASYLKMGLNLTAIHKIINHQLPKPLTYQALKYFVEQDRELAALRLVQKQGAM